MYEGNQTKELIRIREALEASSGGASPLTPSFTRVTTSGTIASGAKYIAIAVLSGSGAILGTPVDTNFEGLEFPYNPAGWGEIAFTVDSSSEFAIITGR